MKIDLQLTPIPATDARFLAALSKDNLPTADLSASRGRFFSASLESQIVGFGGYESLGRVILLRSIVVICARKNGIGRAITNATLKVAKAEGGEAAFLLTENASGFFSSLGFEEIRREDTPAAVKIHPQFDRLCPETSVIMKKPL